MSLDRSSGGEAVGVLALAAAALVAAALIATYVALGGGSYTPLRPANPCKQTAIRVVSGVDGVAQQLALSALDGAACSLGVSREELVLALTSTGALARFAQEHGIGEPALEAAIRQGLVRAVADVQRVGQLTSVQAAIVRAAVEAMPVGRLLVALRGGAGLAGELGGLLAP